MAATEITIHLSDEGHKLALEQIHGVLAGDGEVINRHFAEARQAAERAQDAKTIAERKYVGSLNKLAKLAKPDLTLPERFEVRGDVKANTITIKPLEGEPAPAAPKAKRGGKAR